MDVDLQALPAQVFLVLDQADKNAPGLRGQVYIALLSRNEGGASKGGGRRHVEEAAQKEEAAGPDRPQ